MLPVLAATTIDLRDPIVAAGCVALVLLALLQATKVGLDIRRGLAPQPSYEERFAPRQQVDSLSRRVDQIETWVESKLDKHLAAVEEKIDDLRESTEKFEASVYSELQSIQRALGRLEGTKPGRSA